jgi:hypothetical protein
MSKAPKPTKATRLTTEELVALRWPNHSTAADWLKEHHYSLDELHLNIGMAPDKGVSLYKTSPKITASANPTLTGTSSTSGRGSLAGELRSALTAAYAATDRTCFLRMPKPGNTDALQYLAKFFAPALRTPIEVVDCETGEVVARYEGCGAPAGSVNRAPSVSTDEQATGTPKSGKLVRRTPKTAEAAPNRDSIGRATRRIVTYDQMYDLAARKGGVTNEELTALNGGTNEPWKSYLGLLIKKHPGKCVVTERVDGKVTHWIKTA